MKEKNSLQGNNSVTDCSLAGNGGFQLKKVNKLLIWTSFWNCNLSKTKLTPAYNYTQLEVYSSSIHDSSLITQ